MQMVKKLTVVLALGSVILFGCARVSVYKSAWEQPSSLENESKRDFANDMNYDTESGIMYSLANDSENLFVKMKFSNDVLSTKVIITGLTFWIDTLGKKNKQLGLVFPIKSSKNKTQGRNDRPRPDQQGDIQRRIDTNAFNSRYREGMQTMKLLNYFGEGRVDLVDNQNNEGISALLSMDEENMLYYEAVISLNRIFPSPDKYLNDTTQYFSFGIETGKLEMPSMGNGGRPQMNLSGGGRGSGGAGGQRGGGQGRNAQHSSGSSQQMDPDKIAMMQAMSVESKVWVKKARLDNQVNN